MIPVAFETLRKALSGTEGITPQQGNVALNVLKAAAQVRKSSDKGETSFEQRLRELGVGD